VSGSVGDWGFDLIECHRDLFRPPAGSGEGAECGPGWRDDRCCLRIRTAVEGEGGTFRFTQVKEKYGTARLYFCLRKRAPGSRKRSTRPRPAAPAPARFAARQVSFAAAAG
jgi:hypothetical protein